MTAGRLNLVIEQGATFALALTVDDSGTPRDLTGNTMRMSIRETIDDTDPLLSLTTENGRITILDQGDYPGAFTISLAATDTDDLDFTSGVYDLEVVDGVNVERLLQGKVKLSPEVTRV